MAAVSTILRTCNTQNTPSCLLDKLHLIIDQPVIKPMASLARIMATAAALLLMCSATLLMAVGVGGISIVDDNIDWQAAAVAGEQAISIQDEPGILLATWLPQNNNATENPYDD